MLCPLKTGSSSNDHVIAEIIVIKPKLGKKQLFNDGTEKLIVGYLYS